MQKGFNALLKNIRACEFCRFRLALPPKPIVQLDPRAPILVIAQAPGMRARTSGRPFDDASGDRMRKWLGVDRAIFYDESKMAFMPMGFCYPGTSKTGDLPPCSECAPIWHPQILPRLVCVELVLLVGSYAHNFYLNQSSVSAAMNNWREHLPYMLPLPHPSWHNNNWLKKHQWFEETVIPYLQKRVKDLLGSARSNGEIPTNKHGMGN